MNILKKYWGILVTFIGGLLAAIFFMKSSQRKKERKEIEKDIKERDKKIVTVTEEIKKAKDTRVQIASDIEEVTGDASYNSVKLAFTEINADLKSSPVPSFALLPTSIVVCAILYRL